MLVVLIGSFITQEFSRVVVHPLLNIFDVLFAVESNVCTFGDKASHKAIGIFITASLPESYKGERNSRLSFSPLLLNMKLQELIWSTNSVPLSIVMLLNIV